MKQTLPITFFTAILLTVIFISCEDESTSPANYNIITEGNITLHEDEGYVGLIINTRPIYKKRYFPVTAAISFHNHSKFDTTITIDPSTNLAILSIHRTELTQQDSIDFSRGVALSIVISVSLDQELTSYSSNNYVVDDSNTPLNLTTSLPFIPPTLYYESSVAYLIQPANILGVITSSSATQYSAGLFAGDSLQQQFYVVQAQSVTPNTFLIKHHGYASGKYLYYEESQNYMNLRNGDPEEFILEPDQDGWLRIRHKTTGKFLILTKIQGIDRLSLGTSGMKFRIISDLDWQIEDRGTFYNQPIMGSVSASFAYSEVLTNCSPATLETSIGLSETRSTTSTFSSSESLQLFSSVQVTAGITAKADYKTNTGQEIEAKGVGKQTYSQEVSFGVEATFSASFSTSNTYTTQNTWTEEVQQSREISRTRTITVPPYTKLEIYDILKSIDNVTVPFTQVLRVRSRDRRNNGVALSGPEIVTQLFSNLVTSAIKKVGEDFVDVTIRGNVKINRVLNAYTTVLGDSTGCR
jgi:hypothetical protein